MSEGDSPFDSANNPLNKGVSLLEASAGTGKTYALSRIVLRLVVEEGLEIGKVLVVTFTSAATEELRARIRSLLAEAYDRIERDEEVEDDLTIERLRREMDRETCLRRLRLALASFDEGVICTIHGFCNQVLNENAFETNSLFEAELHKASGELAKEAVEEFWRERFGKAEVVVAAAASTEKLKLETEARFLDYLPKTEEYRLGFEEECNDEVIERELVECFESIRRAWTKERAEYCDYVEECVKKNTKPYKNRSINSQRRIKAEAQSASRKDVREKERSD